MSVNKYFIKESLKRNEIDEYLAVELKRAGYSYSEIAKTPLGTRVVIYAARPGIVIGRRGQSIRDLTTVLEEKFGMENPQISVAPVDSPELDPQVMATQIASALERGIHFRRAAYWGLQRIMRAGAQGAEVIVSGKLSTERARCEKYREGYLPRVGDPVLKQLRIGKAFIQLKQGLFGVQIRLLSPEANFPDHPSLKPVPEDMKKQEEKETAYSEDERTTGDVAGGKEEETGRAAS